MQPSVRTAGSKPAILEVPSTRRAEPEGKPHYVLQTSRNAWNRRKRPPKIRLRSRRKSSPPQLLLQARPLRPIYSPCSMKLTAAGCQRPALVPEEQTAPARCLGSLYPAQKRLRKNGLSERRRVPRGDSDGRTVERCPMGDASRSELSNPGLRGPNTKRAPGRPVRPYTARCASLRGRPPLTTSGAVRRSAHIQASEPSAPTW